MSKQPKEYLKHILDEINYLLFSSKELTEEGFVQNETLRRAYSRSIEIIGEAAKKLPEEFTLKYPEVSWKSLAGMRDKLIHHYFSVDYEIVWDVIANELPRLKVQIEKILS